MAWPITFNSLTNPQPLQDFDTMFNAVASVVSIPSIASGTNAISLTPVTNSPALPAYQELCGARFRAVANSTGPVTAQINGLGFLPVYHGDGVTQATTGDVLNGQQYIVTWSQALNSGLGGFFLEYPSVANAPSTWFTPGGRLTLNSGQPVMLANNTAAQIIYYAPYIGAFVPIYNGSFIQMYQFTSSVTDIVGLQLNMGGGAQWTTNLNYDVYAYLSGGVPALCAVKWTNLSTRASTNTIFGGFLTNSGAVTALTGPATTITLPQNQGTLLGTFATNAAGQTAWQIGSAASGGGLCTLYLDNYYNRVAFNMSVIDNGANYTYSTNTVRQARGSANNAMILTQCSSERVNTFGYGHSEQITAAVNSATEVGFGLNSITTFTVYNRMSNPTATGVVQRSSLDYVSLAWVGTTTISVNETGDGTNANIFDLFQANNLFGAIWL